jgi:hypothetical protein
VFVEQERTKSELGGALSAYLLEEIHNNYHDWSTGSSVLIVLQREAQRQAPGEWRWRWPFSGRAKFDQASQITRLSFALNNVLPSQIRAVLHLPAGTNIVTASRKELQQAASSRQFETRFPHNEGYIAVSQGGFNVNKTETIFYIDHFCGLCGGGAYVLMRKVNGTWRVVEEHSTWIS